MAAAGRRRRGSEDLAPRGGERRDLLAEPGALLNLAGGGSHVGVCVTMWHPPVGARSGVGTG